MTTIQNRTPDSLLEELVTVRGELEVVMASDECKNWDSFYLGAGKLFPRERELRAKIAGLSSEYSLAIRGIEYSVRPYCFLIHHNGQYFYYWFTTNKWRQKERSKVYESYSGIERFITKILDVEYPTGAEKSPGQPALSKAQR